MGLKDAIAKTSQHRETTVVLPISGDTIRLVGMTRREHREWNKSRLNDDGELDEKKEEFANELLVARCAVDELGKRELSDRDVLSGALDNMDAADWTALWSATLGLLSATPKSVEDAIKNSQATAGSVSSGG